MLKLRYLLYKGVTDPIEYIRNDFNEETLALLSLPYTEVIASLHLRTKVNIRYLVAIGILDIQNSTFLYDYLITLTQEQLILEEEGIVKGSIDYSLKAWNISYNVYVDAFMYLIFKNRELRVVSDYADTALIYVSLDDLELARSIPRWKVMNKRIWNNVELKNFVDEYLIFLNDREELRQEAVTTLKILSNDDLTIIISKLNNYGISCQEIMSQLESVEMTSKQYVKIAESLIMTCPNDVDWGFVDNLFTKNALREWWNRRIDI